MISESNHSWLYSIGPIIDVVDRWNSLIFRAVVGTAVAVLQMENCRLESILYTEQKSNVK